MIPRSDFITSLIGRPWVANANGPAAFDCWGLTVHVQRHLFGRVLPIIDVPENLTWHFMIEAFRSHAEREHWREIPQSHPGLFAPPDGSVVLLARVNLPAHAGTWLASERKIIHACAVVGQVCLDDVGHAMNAKRWRKLIAFGPA